MKTMYRLLGLVVVVSALAAPALAVDYDLVILNGRVMDPETNYDAVANVGVKDGRIAIITTDDITGKETIDATGHVVAPGFIDTHAHSVDPLTIRLAALDGCTTAMDMEAGAVGVDEWYAAKKDNWPLNYGTTICHEMTRTSVHDPEVKIEYPVDANNLFVLRAEAGKDGVNGWSVTRSSLEQINEITKKLDEGLRLGALGVGTMPGYARNGITTYEMFEVQRIAARYGRPISIHSRFHASSATPEAQLGFDEVFTNAFLLDAPLLYAHNNDYGWWEIEEKLAMARAKGLNMWSEYYPYTAGSTSANAEVLQPPSFEDVMGLKYEENIYDPTQDKYLTKEEFLALGQTDPGRTLVAFNPPREKWLPKWLVTPHMTAASDSMWQMGGATWDEPFENYMGHPRTAGTHGKVFALGREYGVPLMFALTQMTYWPAKHLGDTGLEAMKVRGRMQEGMVADITIFDPENVVDKATYKAGEQGMPTYGIPYVIVGGRMVVKDSEFQKGVWAGQPIRFPVEEKGRFVPATVEQWLKTFTIDTCPLNPDHPGVH